MESSAAEFAKEVRTGPHTPTLARMECMRTVLTRAVEKAQADYVEAGRRVGCFTVMLGLFEMQAKMIETAIHGGLADFEAAMELHSLSMSVTLGAVQ
jgi:hypothetical protein